jgi:hypothetical protein
LKSHLFSLSQPRFPFRPTPPGYQHSGPPQLAFPPKPPSQGHSYGLRGPLPSFPTVENLGSLRDSLTGFLGLLSSPLDPLPLSSVLGHLLVQAPSKSQVWWSGLHAWLGFLTLPTPTSHGPPALVQPVHSLPIPLVLMSTLHAVSFTWNTSPLQDHPTFAQPSNHPTPASSASLPVQLPLHVS